MKFLVILSMRLGRTAILKTECMEFEGVSCKSMEDYKKITDYL